MKKKRVSTPVIVCEHEWVDLTALGPNGDAVCARCGISQFETAEWRARMTRSSLH